MQARSQQNIWLTVIVGALVLAVLGATFMSFHQRSVRYETYVSENRLVKDPTACDGTTLWAPKSDKAGMCEVVRSDQRCVHPFASALKWKYVAYSCRDLPTGNAAPQLGSKARVA